VRPVITERKKMDNDAASTGVGEGRGEHFLLFPGRTESIRGGPRQPRVIKQAREEKTAPAHSWREGTWASRPKGLGKRTW